MKALVEGLVAPRLVSTRRRERRNLPSEYGTCKTVMTRLWHIYDSQDLGFRVKVLGMFQEVPSLLGKGAHDAPALCPRGGEHSEGPKTALCSSGEGHNTRRCRRATYPESYTTKYTSYIKIKPTVLTSAIPSHIAQCTPHAISTQRVASRLASARPRTLKSAAPNPI